jgi:hypothetical protein
MAGNAILQIADDRCLVDQSHLSNGLMGQKKGRIFNREMAYGVEHLRDSAHVVMYQ